ncbi:hypothetical protein DHD80_17965 [Gramella sp. AN32]|nr:hypothetical protein [Gramella sp. AN32]
MTTNCSAQNKVEKEIHEVLSIAIQDVLASETDTTNILYPPPFPGITQKDSIKARNTFLKIKNPKNYVLAIDPILRPLKIKYSTKFQEHSQILKDLESFENTQKINFNALELSKTYNIIEYPVDYENLTYSFGEDFSLLLSFSRVAFDKNLSKAALLVSGIVEKNSGETILMLFEKRDGKWKIIFSQSLGIS